MPLDPDLIFHRKWWWDPIDMEIFKELEHAVQHQVITISLETQAQMLKRYRPRVWRASAPLWPVPNTLKNVD